MSITATIKNYIHFEGDQESEMIFGSGPLINSPSVVELVTLIIGDNLFLAPALTGFVTHGVAILPPHANVEEILLKGDPADVGIILSASNVSVIHLGADPVSITLEVTVEIIGLRLVWF